MNLTIEEIELDGFTGMWLNDIRHFKLTLKETITLILGRNGSGKSRLMEQLSPLAPNKTDLYDNGFKRIVCRTATDTYELICKRSGKGLKCTIKNLSNGQIVCENANPKVFNGFVKDIFGYTKDLHDLFTGQVRLTAMKTPERRKWFSILSESDLTYALSFYKKSREQLRDTTGLIKQLKRSISELRPTVLDREEDRIQLKSRIGVLQNDITSLDSALRQLATDENITTQTLDVLDKKLNELYSEIMVTEMHVPENFADYDEISINNELSYLQGKLNGELSKLEDLEARINKATQINSVDINDLEAALDEHTFNYNLSKSKLTMFKELADMSPDTIMQAKNTLSSYTDPISKAMVTIADYPVDGNVHEVHQALVKELGELQIKINKLTNHEVQLSEQLKHIEGICDVTCVKCSHKFKPGVGTNDSAEIKERAAKTADMLKQAKESYEKLYAHSNKVAKVLEATNSVNWIIGSFSSNRASKLLIDSLVVTGVFNGTCASQHGIVEQFIYEIDLASQMVTSKREVDRYLNDIKIAKATQAEDVTMLKELAKSANYAIDVTNSSIKELNVRKQVAHDLDLVQNRIKEMDAEMATGEAEYGRVTKILKNNVLAEVISKEKANLWDLLTAAKQRFSAMEEERQRLEFQEKQLVDAEKRLEANKLIVKSMSPDEGLLAKYLYQCITRITDLMTGYIEGIWGYPMKILPCEVSDGEMDYQFPFYARDRSRTSADVSHGSKAQKEVIDFVFVLSAYRARGMQQFPLLLDEISSGFDEGHRGEMIEFVKELVGKQHHSQCVMVSHDSTSHFKLTHADVVVIDPEGITVPDVYNQNVEIS